MDNNIIEEKVKVTKNSPFYDHVMLCYKVEWKFEDGWTQADWFDTYSEGVDFLKNKFPQWFSKHYKN